MLTFCKSDMPGLIKGELEVFQRVLQLDSAHDLEAVQWSILLSYLLTVFRGSDSEVDSAASLLLSQPRWLESLETQLVEPGHVRATGFMVLQRLIDIQLRAHMPCGGAVLLEKRSLQSELHAGPEGGVVAAMALLRALLAQQLWPTGRGLAVRLKTPLSLADYSALLYTLAGHAAKINTAVDEPAVECLEVIFLFVDLVSDTDLVSRLAAHPWLNSVLLECRLLHAGPSLSITTLRIVLLVLQGAHTNQLIVEQLPFIVDCLSTQGKSCISLSRRIAVKLLSGGYHRHLSEQSRGKLRHLLSPAEDTDPVQQRQQQQQQPRAILPA
ncbi:uncharacterized protein LOC115318463 [Ixodes scapularis]|uniref:uncharacterized protein LOC115318463 n=1 Tax=Ixodes scapularis TaxID=6945 RepID=UPI001A9D56DF|nr:uncharacterized protein LOC115318463 [Ixodes scapularis]